MAKFLVTSGSHFNPFTYDELAKPVMQAVEAHTAAADAYDTLSSGAEALRQYIIREPNDSEARSLYDSYMSKLDQLQNNLWERGYNANTRRDLSAARAGYQSDITRLATAVKDRSDRSAAYWDAKHKNPNLVTGRDPGIDSLDDYLRDANHGLNWFSYDSAQFEKDVFAEMQARAKSMISDLTDPNGVVTNPVLKDTLTRVISKGVTNAEVDAASSLVDLLINLPASERDKFYRLHSDEISPVVQMLTESLINRYDATGIRGYDVDEAEKQKLINRGKAGLAGGVMTPDIKDFNNPEYEFEIWKRKQQWTLDHTPSNGNGSGGGSGTGYDNGNLKPIDTDTRRAPGDNYEVARKRYDKEFPKLPRTIITSDGKQVNTTEQAADIVYGGGIRRKYYEQLGIDVGRNPNSLTSSGYLTGVTVGADGQEYEIQYNPKAKISGDSERGGIRYRPLGSKTDWDSCPYSETWTKQYRAGRKAYEENLEYYKKNEKELYKAGKSIDPDKQYEIYERDNIGFNTPLIDYASVQFNKPDNNPNAVFSKHYVAQNGTDAGKLTLRLSGYLSNHLGFDGGNPIEDKEIKTYHNTSRGIHRISKSGGLSPDAVQAGDAFRFDEDGNITNAKGVIITPESILDLGNDGSFGSGYIILNTSKGMYSVNVDMFDSDRLRSLFKTAQAYMDAAMKNPEFTDDDVMMEFNDIADDLCRDIQALIGIDLTTKSTTGTAGKEDK